MDLPPRSAMAPSAEHWSAQVPPYADDSPSTDVEYIFGFMPPDDTPSTSGRDPSRPARTQSSRVVDLSQGPISISSHSRSLTTPPTATSTSFPVTPRSNGPNTPLTPSWNLEPEQRFETIQSRITSVPSTGGSGGMMFSFRPPTQDSALSPPMTRSQLSAITESGIQGSLPRGGGANSEEFVPSAPNTGDASR